MLELIKSFALQLIKDIDAGNSNINEELLAELVSILLKINYKEFSKLEAADYIGVSRATFDNRVKAGIIPEGIKKRGSTKFWNKSDLDKYLNLYEHIRK